MSEDYFQVVRQVSFGERKFDVIGNIKLLERSLVSVHCRSQWTLEEVNAYRNNLVLQARKGAVLVGAFISEKERELLQVAYKEELSVIHIRYYGFSNQYRPTKADRVHCEKGLLLELSPWPARTFKDPLTREVCVAMNLIAEDIAMKR